MDKALMTGVRGGNRERGDKLVITGV